MLLELNVKDLALIKKAGVSFGEGLNILTGETGAGKSIIIGSIALALGAKAKSDIVRDGAEYAYIELVFSESDPKKLRLLSALEVEPQDGLIVVSRKIGKTRSQSKINDESVTAGKLREVMGLLIDLYGQHEYQTLLDQKKHLEFLDEYLSAEIAGLREAAASAYRSYREALGKTEAFSLKEEERLRELDFAEFEIAEIEAAALKEGEEEELAAQYRRMNHAKKILEHIECAFEALSQDAAAAALSEVGEALRYDETLSDVHAQLADADSILAEARHELRTYADRFETDEAGFYEIETRLDLIRGVLAKYGGTVEAAEAYREKKEKRRDELLDYEFNKKACEKVLSEAKETLLRACRALSEARKEGALRFSEAVKRELLELGFSEVSFALQFSEKEPAADGFDAVRFMAALNPGEPIRPLTEAASGGELSRMMLAVKTVMAETDEIPTLLFDEIDAGISGRTAQMVAEKLNLIAGCRQVLCITHLPQIAAMADTHFVIRKETQDGRSVTEIEKLSEGEIPTELSRLLGGAEITEAVLKNALEMKRLATERKKTRRKHS